MATKGNIQIDVEKVESNDETHVAQSQYTQKTTEKWWMWEFVAWVIGLAALFAIVALLMKYQNKPAPYSLIGRKVRLQWRGYGGEYGVHFTINSYISIFATIFKACLAVPITAALSQLKWTWFRQSRPLSDYALIDKAKLGTTGSLTLLWKFKGRHLASLGAFLLVAALALDFAFQSLIQYPLRPLIVDDATVLRTQGYSSIGTSGNSAAVQIDSNMLTAMVSGVYGFNTTDDSSRHVSPSCSTGNCTWPEYTSLAVCSQCFDTTDQIQQDCGNTTIPIDGSVVNYCNYTLPNTATQYGNLSIPGVYDYYGSGMTAVNLSASYTGGGLSFETVNNAFAVLSVLNGVYSSDDSLTGATATQCALTFCVKRYSAYVANGTLHETVKETFYNNSLYTPYDEDSSDYKPFELRPGKAFESSSANASEVYSVSFQTWVSIGQKLAQVWSGAAFESGKQLDTSDTATILKHLGFGGVVNVTASLAESMTTTMRNTGDIADVSNSNTNPAYRTVHGAASQNVPYVVIEWRWIILPAGLLFLALVFAILTVRTSNSNGGTMLWKGLSLASFYQPLTGDGRNELSMAKNSNHLDEIAAGLNVQWMQTEKGWRLAKHRYD